MINSREECITQLTDILETVKTIDDVQFFNSIAKRDKIEMISNSEKYLIAVKRNNKIISYLKPKEKDEYLDIKYIEEFYDNPEFSCRTFMFFEDITNGFIQQKKKIPRSSYIWNDVLFNKYFNKRKKELLDDLTLDGDSTKNIKFIKIKFNIECDEIY